MALVLVAYVFVVAIFFCCSPIRCELEMGFVVLLVGVIVGIMSSIRFLKLITLGLIRFVESKILKRSTEQEVASRRDRECSKFYHNLMISFVKLQIGELKSLS